MKNEKMVFKSIVKAKDMDEEMFVKIEKWARETFEDSKVKYKDEMVNNNYLSINRIIGSC